MAIVINPTIRDSSDRWDTDCEDELHWWPRVMWVDPGQVTGVSVLWIDPKALLRDGSPTPRCVLAWWEHYVSGPEDSQVDQYMDIVHALGDGPGLALGIETFIPRQLNMAQEFLSPVRLRAAYEYAARPRKIHAQQPSDALTVITDARLKSWNMYTPGPDHIRDATRHALLWTRKLRGSQHGELFFRRVHGWEPDWFVQS